MDSKRLTITVTAKDIRDGDPKNCESCAVALAAKRMLLGRVRVSPYGDIEASHILIGDRRYKPTKKLAAFIEQFDTDKSKCKPTSFTVEKANVPCY